jgi:hypothetical protein
MIKAKNLWQQHQLSSLKTVADVDFKLAKVKRLRRDAHPDYRSGLDQQITILERLRKQLEGERGL